MKHFEFSIHDKQTDLNSKVTVQAKTEYSAWKELEKNYDKERYYVYGVRIIRDPHKIFNSVTRSFVKKNHREDLVFDSFRAADRWLELREMDRSIFKIWSVDD